ncbi:VOC family protein [Bdellovibrio bacteriovorus]
MAKSKLLRMDNVGIMVSDMKKTVAFFKELGLEVQGEATVEGKWVDKILALENVKCDIVMMQSPGSEVRLELSEFKRPKVIVGEQQPVNTAGLHRIMFAVTDIKETAERLRGHGAEMLDEIVQYENAYLLCYLRGPDGIIVALAQEL